MNSILLKRFWRYVNKSDGCWKWSGPTRKGGYGVMRMDGKLVSAHRFSVMAFRGPIPPGKQVLHTCDDPRCVNPEHLRVGTRKDNMQDALRKGRLVSSLPTKLTPSGVVKMRQLANSGETPHELAKRYGVHIKTVRNALDGKTWANVSGIKR